MTPVFAFFFLKGPNILLQVIWELENDFSDYLNQPLYLQMKKLSPYEGDLAMLNSTWIKLMERMGQDLDDSTPEPLFFMLSYIPQLFFMVLSIWKLLCYLFQWD